MEQIVRGPLRPALDGGPESPEALFISAMLEVGEFNPEHYHVSEEDMGCWTKVFTWCTEHQAVTGRAPALSLVAKQFPEFEITSDVDPAWAAGLVRRASAARTLRERMRDALGQLGDEDVEGAYALFEGLTPPRKARREPVSVLDHSTVADEELVEKIEVPYQSLGRVTGGIGTNEFWVIGARWATGKTRTGMQYAARGAQTGYRVGWISLEMPAYQVGAIAQRALAGHDQALLNMLDSDQARARMEALDMIRARTPGVIDVIDPSHGNISSTVTVQEICHDYDLVVVDHVGLLKTADSKRPAGDWGLSAQISNTLREITLALPTRILGMSQVNREGENSSSRPPKGANLSNTDALGQDADVVVMMKRLSDRVMAHESAKNRNGATVRWWSRFDVRRNDYGEISRDEASELGVLDADLETMV